MVTLNLDTILWRSHIMVTSVQMAITKRWFTLIMTVNKPSDGLIKYFHHISKLIVKCCMVAIHQAETDMGSASEPQATT